MTDERSSHTVTSLNRGLSLAVIGGHNQTDYIHESIEILECSNGNCEFRTTRQELNLAQNKPVAIGVPTSIARCNPELIKDSNTKHN